MSGDLWQMARNGTTLLPGEARKLAVAFDKMRQELDDLRNGVAAVEAERNGLTLHSQNLQSLVEKRTAECNRLHAQLFALRNPSDAVMKAAVLYYSGDLSDAIRASVAAAEVPCIECDGKGVTAKAVCCGSGFGNECCGCPDQHMVPCPNGCDPRQHVMGYAARYIAAIDRVEDAKAAREAAQTARGVANKGDVIADAHRALAAATDERDAALEALRAAVAAAEQEVGNA